MEPDPVGIRTLELLTQACERGVSVSLIIDGFGSSNMTDAHFADLQKAGGVVLRYNPWHVFRVFNKIANFENLMFFAYRNHKKCVVIDGRVGYTGGMNIGGEYCSQAIHGGINKFRDTHCRLRGPVVKLLQDAIYYSIIDIDPQISLDDVIEDKDKDILMKNYPVTNVKKSSSRFFPGHLLQSLQPKKKYTVLSSDKAINNKSTTTTTSMIEEGTWIRPWSRWGAWSRRNGIMTRHPFTRMPKLLTSIKGMKGYIDKTNEEEEEKK